jgi:hypothetical protein
MDRDVAIAAPDGNPQLARLLADGQAMLRARRTDPSAVRAFLTRANRSGLDFHVVKALRCVAAAVHLRNERLREADRAMVSATRGVGRLPPGCWSDVVTDCQRVVPEFELLREIVQRRDAREPRYFWTGYEESLGGRNRRSCPEVVLEANSLELMTGREWLLRIGVDSASAEQEQWRKLPRAPAAFAVASPETYAYSDSEHVTAAADPESREGVLSSSEGMLDRRFLRSTPLAASRRALKDFLAEAAKHDDGKWETDAWGNGVARWAAAPSRAGAMR